MAGPLTDLLKKDGTGDKTPLELPQKALDSFNKLKKALCSAPILAFPDFESDEPFVVDSDWSATNNAVGAVLSQVQGHGKDRRERVLAYMGKKLSKSQAAYGSTKGELAGIIIAIRHWSYFLKHRPFVLRTDHHGLKWIHSLEAPVGMIQRWLQTLANYQFRVIHRAGRKHGNSDALSRAPHLADSSGTDVSAGETIAYLREDERAVESQREGAGWTPSWVKEYQQADPVMRKLVGFILRKEKPTREDRLLCSAEGRVYYDQFDKLEVDSQGLLRLRVRDQHGVDPDRVKGVVLLPRDIQLKAVEKVHEDSGHPGRDELLRRCQRAFYFHQMLRTVVKCLQLCRRCQIKTGRPQPQKHSLYSHVDGMPMDQLSTDTVGPLPVSTKGNRYLLTFRCTFTRWIEAFPVKRANAAEVVKVLLREIVPRFGLPSRLHSDRGTPYVSDLLHDVAQTLGIQLTTTPSYSPKSNVTERAHRDIGNCIKAVVGEDVSRWEEALPQVLHALRTARCRTTGFAPFQLLFGADPSLPLEHVFGHPDPSPSAYRSYHDYVDALRCRIERAHAWARENISATVARRRRDYYKDKVLWEPGTKVWLFTPRLRPGQSKKFATYWTGPWTVVERVNNVMYRIRPDPSWMRKKEEVVAVDRLKRCYENEGDPHQQHPPDEQADLSMAGDEFAEFIDEPDEQEPGGGGGGGGGGVLGAPDVQPPPPQPPPDGPPPQPPPPEAPPAPPPPRRPRETPPYPPTSPHGPTTPPTPAAAKRRPPAATPAGMRMPFMTSTPVPLGDRGQRAERRAQARAEDERREQVQRQVFPEEASSGPRVSPRRHTSASSASSTSSTRGSSLGASRAPVGAARAEGGGWFGGWAQGISNTMREYQNLLAERQATREREAAQAMARANRAARRAALATAPPLQDLLEAIGEEAEDSQDETL